MTLLNILLQLATRTVTVSHGFVPVGFFLLVTLLGLLLLHFTCHAAKEKYSAKKNFHQLPKGVGSVITRFYLNQAAIARI